MNCRSVEGSGPRVERGEGVGRTNGELNGGRMTGETEAIAILISRFPFYLSTQEMYATYALLALCCLVVFLLWMLPRIRQRPPARIWTYRPSGKEEKGVTVITDTTLHGYLRISPEILRAPIFGPHRAALVMLHALEEGGIWWDGGTLGPLNWKGAWEYAEGEGWHAAQRGSTFVRQWRMEFEEMLRYASVEDYVKDRGKAVDLSAIADPLGHPELVAREKILQYDRYPRESLGLRPSMRI